MAAARARAPSTTRVKLPPLAGATIDGVQSVCQAALRALTGGAGAPPATRRPLSVQDLPDDRPTQTCATEYVTEVRLGDLATFRCVEVAGGWSRGSADWTTDDFAGTGRLRMSFETDGVELEGAPAVVDALATLLRSRATAS